MITNELMMGTFSKMIQILILILSLLMECFFVKGECFVKFEFQNHNCDLDFKLMPNSEIPI